MFFIHRISLSLFNILYARTLETTCLKVPDLEVPDVHSRFFKLKIGQPFLITSGRFDRTLKTFLRRNESQLSVKFVHQRLPGQGKIFGEKATQVPVLGFQSPVLKSQFAMTNRSKIKLTGKIWRRIKHPQITRKRIYSKPTLSSSSNYPLKAAWHNLPSAE